MTCKDCFHHEVCSQFSKADGANHEYYSYTNLSEKCECFKDKSRLANLPCKIGDTAYGIRDYNGGKRVMRGKVSEMLFTDDMRLLIVIKHICRGEAGKNIFFTRENAEKALAERCEKQ